MRPFVYRVTNNYVFRNLADEEAENTPIYVHHYITGLWNGAPRADMACSHFKKKHAVIIAAKNRGNIALSSKVRNKPSISGISNIIMHSLRSSDYISLVLRLLAMTKFWASWPWESVLLDTPILGESVVFKLAYLLMIH